MPYKNIEARRENRRAYYRRNREKVLARQTLYRDMNIEKRKRYMDQYRLEHPDRCLESQVKYREKHRDRKRLSNRKYMKAHPEKLRHYKQTRRAREQNATGCGTTSLADIQMRWAYYSGLCWMCGKPADHLDHVKPLSKGGSHLPCNLRPACASCNHKKSNKWIPINSEAERKTA